MKKSKFTTKELQILLEALERCKEPDDVMLETRNSISQNILFDNKYSQAYNKINAEVFKLELKARRLKRVIKAFKAPIKDMPIKINDDNETIATIAQWRLKLGR